MNAWVIDRPELQTATQKFIYTLLTLGMWGFWLYLWLPLLSPWKEELGINGLLDTHFLHYSGFEYLLTLVIVVTVAAAVMGVILGAWALYNKKAFGRSRRRKAYRADKTRIARYFKVNEDDLRIWQNVNCVYVTHTPDGDIDMVKVHDFGRGKFQDLEPIEPIPQEDIFKNLFR